MRLSITAAAALAALALTTTAQAAERVSLENQGHLQFLGKQDLVGSLGLEKGTAFSILKQFSLPNGKSYFRMQQTFRGLKIFGEHVVQSQNEHGFTESLGGAVYRGIEADLENVRPTLSPRKALAIAKKQANSAAGSFMSNSIYRNEKSELQIYTDSDRKAHLAYVVEFFQDIPEGGKPSRPFTIIDAVTGKVLEQWEGINHAEATGPGGNLKTGKYQFGTDFGSLNVSDNCTMENDKVITINLNHLESGTKPYQFTCPNNTFK
jgi:vibriolysin